jgi:vacuolar-type H+-ATPase subunit H
MSGRRLVDKARDKAKRRVPGASKAARRDAAKHSARMLRLLRQIAFSDVLDWRQRARNVVGEIEG